MTDSPQLIGRNRVGVRGTSLGAAAPPLARRPFEAEQEPVGAIVPKTAAELRADEEARRDSQPMSTSCAFCEWSFEGTAAECRYAARMHREREHPLAANRLGRRGAQSKPKRQRTEAENAQIAREAVEARRVRQEREDAERLAHIERGRQRDALAAMDAGESQDREEETLQGPHLDAEQPEPQPASSPPPRDESGLEEASVAAGADGGGASSSPTTDDEGETMEASTNGRAKKWPRERVIAATQEVAAEVGGTPSITQMVARGYSFAPSCTKLGLGTYTQLVKDAGLEPNTRGGNTRSGRGPLAAPEDGGGGAHPSPVAHVTPAAAPAAEPGPRPENSPRDPLRTADLPFDAEILADEAAFLRERADALDQLAAGIRTLARLSHPEEIAA